MAQNGWNHMPRPEPIWIALGIVVAALTAALGRRRRAAFLAAMRALIDQHEARERVVAFGRRTNGRTMSRAVLGGVSWLRRLVEELDHDIK